MITTLPIDLKIEIDEFLTKDEYENLKKNYKGKKIAFYVFLDNQNFKGQYLNGNAFHYDIADRIVEKIYKKMPLDLDVYTRHKFDINENRDNIRIGKTVYKTLIRKNGILLAIVGILIENEDLYYSDNFDAISLEAINLKTKNNNVEDFDITSFALTNSKKNLPAGDFAYKIDEIQLYFNKNAKEFDKENMRDITLEDVKEYIRANKIKPSELFDSYTILGSIEINENGIHLEGGDERIYNILRQKFKNYVPVKKDEFESFKKLNEEYLQIKPKYENYKSYFLDNIKKQKLNEYIESNQIDEKLKKFLLINSDDLKISDEGNIESEIKSFVDSYSKKFKILLETLNENNNGNHTEKPKSDSSKNYF